MEKIKKEVSEYVERPEVRQKIRNAVKKCKVRYNFDDFVQETTYRLLIELDSRPDKLIKCNNNINYLYSMALGTCKNIIDSETRKENNEKKLIDKVKKSLQEQLEVMAT
ncbi:hypothetical protein KK120_18675 [Virgibacillus dakarensis]|nr:hypothetical protein [Virgibacillus dakarensis]